MIVYNQENTVKVDKKDVYEKTNDKDIKQIGYDKRPEKVKTRSDERRFER